MAALKQAELGVPLAEVIRKGEDQRADVSSSCKSFYRWRKQYVGGMETDQIRHWLRKMIDHRTVPRRP